MTGLGSIWTTISASVGMADYPLPVMQSTRYRLPSGVDSKRSPWMSVSKPGMRVSKTRASSKWSWIDFVAGVIRYPGMITGMPGG